MTKLTVVAVAIAALVLAVPGISQASCGMPHGNAGYSQTGHYGGPMYAGGYGGYGSGYRYTASYGSGYYGANLGYTAGQTVTCGSCEPVRPVCRPACDPCDPCRGGGFLGLNIGW